MTPFFTLLAYLKLNDPLFYFSQVLNDPLFIISFYPIAPPPPFSSKSYYPMAHLFSLWHLYTYLYTEQLTSLLVSS